MVDKALIETCEDLKLSGVIGSKTIPPVVKFYNSGDEETQKLANAENDKSSVEESGQNNQETIPIFLFCEKDCKSGIVDAAVHLFDKRTNDKSTPTLPEALLNKDLDTATLNNALNKQIGWPETDVGAESEPDLMMVFGNVKSTLGFLPWHIRLTEIQ